jgi:DNA-binding transcriptional regulator PaaX
MKNMHPKKKADYGDITKCVMKLIGAGLLYGAIGGMSGSPDKINKIAAGYFDYSRKQIRRCVTNLRLRGYIQYDKTDTKSPLRLTSRGLVRARTHERAEKIAMRKLKRWDYLWRFVSFDIPEPKKRCRDVFRNYLRDLGFFPYQKSAYIAPFDVQEDIRETARSLGIGRYVLQGVMPNLDRREVWARRWFADEID